MAFSITINHDRRNYKYRVEFVRSDQSFDYYRLMARNKELILKSNSPILKRHNLKYRKPEWKIVSGDIWNPKFAGKVIEAIEAELNRNL